MRKSYKKPLALFLVMTITVAGMTDYQRVDAKAKKKVKEIAVQKPEISSLYLKKGEKFRIKYKVRPANASNRKVAFATSNKKVATISAKGVIQAKKPGAARITLKAKDGSRKKASIQIKVVKKLKPVKKLFLNKKKATLYLSGSSSEKTLSLKASVVPGNATVKKLEYRSSDNKVASVSKKGIITAKKAGKASITAFAADGRGAKAVCQIVVENSPSNTNAPQPPGTSSVPAPTPEEPAVRIGTKVVVTTEDNFRSYVTISIPLPSGVKKSDITGFRMGVDSGTDLSLRLYAGSQKQTEKELTSRSTVIQDEVTGTSSVNVDGKVIPKTSHRLSIQESQSSWGKVKAGQLRLAKIPMDDRARALLSDSTEEALTVCLYAHNCQPQYGFYTFQIEAGGQLHTIQLGEDNVKASDGASITFEN